MSIRRLLAQATVSDLATAEQWFSTVLDRQPDARPMDGLIEYHLSDSFGIQVWSEPDRAGRSTVVLDVSDLDALVSRLTEVGVDHPGPQPASSSRILPLNDPDGNRLVFTGQ